MSRPSHQPVELSVVIVNWNTRDLLRECLESVLQDGRDRSLEVIVIDNASEDGSAAMVAREFPQVQLHRNAENVGFAKANNQVFPLCEGEFVLLLNPDARLESGALTSMIEHLRANPDVGAVGPLVVSPSGRGGALHAGEQPCLRTVTNHYLGLSRLFPRSTRLLGTNLLAGLHDDKPRSVGWISGACLLIRTAVIRSVGGFSESWFMYAEDMEWCSRVCEQGWRLEHLPTAVAVHHVGAGARQARDTSVMWIRSLREWYAWRCHAGLPQLLTFNVVAGLGLTMRSLFRGMSALLGPRSIRAEQLTDSRRLLRYARVAGLDRPSPRRSPIDAQH